MKLSAEFILKGFGWFEFSRRVAESQRYYLEEITVRLNEISGVIVDSAFKLHNKLGPGLLESVYERVLCYELAQRGLRVKSQVALPLIYEGIRFDIGFRIDLLVEGCVVVELKSVEAFAAVHSKQVLTYLRAGNFELGLLLNFGAALMKDGIKRIANNLPDQNSIE